MTETFVCTAPKHPDCPFCYPQPTVTLPPETDKFDFKIYLHKLLPAVGNYGNNILLGATS